MVGRSPWCCLFSRALSMVHFVPRAPLYGNLDFFFSLAEYSKQSTFVFSWLTNYSRLLHGVGVRNCGGY